MAKEDYWIQNAIQRPGSLRAYVQRKYGRKGFTKSRKTGRLIIRLDVLRKLSKKSGKVGQRARLALKLRRYSGKRKSRKRRKRRGRKRPRKRRR